MPKPSTVLPRLNGGSVEKGWQPMSAERWNLPVSRSSSLIAENTGHSGQPTQKPGGRSGAAREDIAPREALLFAASKGWRSLRDR